MGGVGGGGLGGGCVGGGGWGASVDFGLHAFVVVKH